MSAFSVINIIHTSDWHLGQSFFTKSRKQEHQAFLTWLLAEIEKNQVDAVIVAGDVFDTGAPPSYAREMYNQFVVAMHQRNCALIVLGGNHDSVAMLKESQSLFACLNTHVIANTSDNVEDQIITLNNRAGEVGALLCAVPFVRPRDVLTSQEGESGIEKRQALGEAIKQHYHQLYQAALARRETNGWQVPIITSGHLVALGVSASTSVRDIYIGSLDAFAADGFPPADYIALGHIHRPQLVAKSEHIRYSGSPIPLSFDELKSAKQVVLVQFDAQTSPQITPIDIPCFQPLASLKGSLAQIAQQLAQFSAPQPDAAPTWLHIEVAVDDHLSDLRSQIEQMIDGLHVEVLQLIRARTHKNQSLTTNANESLAELTPIEVFEKRLACEPITTPEEQARSERIKQQFAAIVHEIDADKAEK